MILTADWHLTDRPEDEYRWAVFDRVIEQVRKLDDHYVIMAGDLGDRKDKHSASLLNRMLDEFGRLAEEAEVVGIMGNHDKALRGLPFWNVLNLIDGVEFFADPAFDEDRGILFLPFADVPVHAWNEIDLDAASMIVLHQPITGAVSRGYEITGSNMPIMPDVPIYAGDIHDPQYIEGAGITYIGAPHPVNFGDTHQCRLLQIDDRSKRIKEVIELSPARKHVFAVSSIDALKQLVTMKGDKARVRFTLEDGNIENWAATKRAIEEWAEAQHVELASIEPIVELPEHDATASGDLTRSPQDTLIDYIEAESIPDSHVEVGFNLLAATLERRG